MHITILEYLDAKGCSPYRDWLNRLDRSVKARIQARLMRVETGNFGDYRVLDDGLAELRFAFGAGYRVYFGMLEKEIIILLGAGDKGTQNKDIKKAKKSWEDYIGGRND